MDSKAEKYTINKYERGGYPFAYIHRGRLVATELAKQDIEFLLEGKEASFTKKGFKQDYNILFRDLKAYRLLDRTNRGNDRGVKVYLNIEVISNKHYIAVLKVNKSIKPFTLKRKIIFFNRKIKYMIANRLNISYNQQ